MRFLVLLLMFFGGFFCLAQAAQPPADVTGLLAYLQQFITAIGNGDWKVIGGIALMGIMVAVRQYVMPKAKIDPDHLPLIMAAITGLSFAGMSAISPEVDFLTALKSGLLTSGVAAMAWELGGKLLFEKVLGIELYRKDPFI